ncbi:acyltransferase family protein [Photobacterium damselae]|uniref:acyltransferase family protein n=1 Tax=Photobacterium damselae TaxID=38293 RepID=UPI002543EA95
MNKRYASIDAIKGLMILLVVFGHTIYVGYCKNDLIHMRNLVYIFHMPIFLMVSGFLFKYEYNISASFYKMMRKLLIPYLLFYTLYLIILWAVSTLSIINTSNHVDSYNEFFELLFFKPEASFWYLHSLIIFSSSIFVSAFLDKVIKINSIIFVVVFSCVIQFIVSMFGFNFHLWVAFYLWLGFIFKLCMKDNFNYKSLFLLLLISICSFYIGRLEQFIISIVILFFLFLLFERFNFQRLEFIGKNSFVILVFHVFFLNVLKFFNSLFLSIDDSGILFVIISVITSVFGSILVGILLDKVKLSNLTFGDKCCVKN